MNKCIIGHTIVLLVFTFHSMKICSFLRMFSIINRQRKCRFWSARMSPGCKYRFFILEDLYFADYHGYCSKRCSIPHSLGGWVSCQGREDFAIGGNARNWVTRNHICRKTKRSWMTGQMSLATISCPLKGRSRVSVLAWSRFSIWDKVLQRAQDSRMEGKTSIYSCNFPQYWVKADRIAEHPRVFLTVGQHPHVVSVQVSQAIRDREESLIRHPKCIAVGEMKWWCFRPLLCTLLRLNWANSSRRSVAGLPSTHLTRIAAIPAPISTRSSERSLCETLDCTLPQPCLRSSPGQGRPPICSQSFILWRRGWCTGLVEVLSEGSFWSGFFYYIECFTTTFLRAHSWLNWVVILVWARSAPQDQWWVFCLWIKLWWKMKWNDGVLGLFCAHCLG